MVWWLYNVTTLCNDVRTKFKWYSNNVSECKQTYNNMRCYVTMTFQCYTVTMMYIDVASLSNVVQHHSNTLQQGAINFHDVHVWYDGVSKLLQCKVMRVQGYNIVQQEKYNVIWCATMYNVTAQCYSLLHDVVTLCNMMLQCMSSVQQRTMMYDKIFYFLMLL